MSRPRKISREVDGSIPVEKLTGEELLTFFRAYMDMEAISARSKRTFAHSDYEKTVFALLLGADQKHIKIEALQSEQKALVEKLKCRNPALAAKYDQKPVAPVAKRLLESGMIMLLRTRNWQILEWLAAYVKTHAETPYPTVGDVDAMDMWAPELEGVVLKEFVTTSGSSLLSLYTWDDPAFTRLPTKKGLQKSVEAAWEKVSGKTDNIGPEFSRALKKLGLSGLPGSRERSA